jgi:ApaG protein
MAISAKILNLIPRVDFYMSEENKILVEVKARYIEDQSKPSEHKYAFAYTITIANVGTTAAKLLSRYWLITDSNGKVEEVRGAGVVGKTPYLKPGETFTYTSGALINTAVGVMQGKYRMVADDGKQFDAVIPKFTLSIPRTLH